MIYETKMAELRVALDYAKAQLGLANSRHLKAKSSEQRQSAGRRMDYWRKERTRLEQEIISTEYAAGEIASNQIDLFEQQRVLF